MHPPERVSIRHMNVPLTIVCITHYSVCMDTNDALVQSQYQEIRRGSVVTAALSLLRTPQYGYALLEQLNEAGIEVEANTLYPLLRRLEGQDLLIAEWNTEEARPRKYYRTSSTGTALVALLGEEWRRLAGSLDVLLGMEDQE